MHPEGVIIHARQMRNERTSAILASGPGSSVNVVSDDFTNSGVVRIDDESPEIKR